GAFTGKRIRCFGHDVLSMRAKWSTHFCAASRPVRYFQRPPPMPLNNGRRRGLANSARGRDLIRPAIQHWLKLTFTCHAEFLRRFAPHARSEERRVGKEGR